MKVRAVMSRPVITIEPRASIKDAANLLTRHAISALPVVDADGSLVGIVSEADLLQLETRPDPRSQARPMAPTAGTTPRTVADVMSSPVITIRADSEVSQAARVMIDSDVKRLPVMDRDRLTGIVSRRDLVKVIARDDDDLRLELTRRLHEAGVGFAKGAVSLQNGIATIRLEDRGPNRRLAESVALTVPGVLEVRFTT